VIYITHFLDEIFTICERVTIMRNGETCGRRPISDVDPAKSYISCSASQNEDASARPVSEGEPLSR